MRLKIDSTRKLLLAMLIAMLIFGLLVGVSVIIKNEIQKRNDAKFEMKPIEHEHSIYGDEELGISPEVDEQLKDYHNIALLGIDTAEIKDKKGNRSDAIIIVSIHRQTKEVKIFSIYRDTFLMIDDDYLDKINHAYAFGGTEQTLRAINRNLELNVRDAVVMPWNAVRDTVDALGGVDVEISQTEKDFLNQSLPSDNKIKGTGIQTIDGEQAVLYSRIRKDDPRGDRRRNERFKIVMMAAFEKSKEYDLDKLTKVMSDVMEEVDSRMAHAEILELFLDMSYEIDESFEWPYKERGMMYNKVSYIAPITLEYNVERLHEEMFGQEDYQAGEFVQDVSSQIEDIVNN